jgi:hypothetical protein
MMKKCKLCDAYTKNEFNIKFKLVPICEDCANAILLQQAEYLALLSKRLA